MTKIKLTMRDINQLIHYANYKGLSNEHFKAVRVKNQKGKDIFEKFEFEFGKWTRIID